MPVRFLSCLYGVPLLFVALASPFVLANSSSSSITQVTDTVSVAEHEHLHQQLQQLQEERRLLNEAIGRQEREIARYQDQERNYQQLVEELDQISDGLQRQLATLRMEIPHAKSGFSRQEAVAQDSPEPVLRFLASLNPWLNELAVSTRLSTWPGWLDGKQVSFVRLGRIGLYALSPDDLQASMYQPDVGQWRELSLIETQEVVRAREMAADYRDFDWLFLPIAGMTQELSQ